MTTELCEDEAQTLLFADILGYARLTESHPRRVDRAIDSETGFHSASTSPLQNQINAFYSVLNQQIQHEGMNGKLQAMLFSDCAFVAAGNSLRTALIAVQMMRECIKRQVPVRMGLGRGTFYLLGMSTESDGQTLISRSRFGGTAVVRAHSAEQCGNKGMRIFLHPSLEMERPLIENRIRVLPLTDTQDCRGGVVSGELDFLYEAKPAGQLPAASEEDMLLFERVSLMASGVAAEFQNQYTATWSAMNRMRVANARSEVPLPVRNQIEFLMLQWCSTRADSKLASFLFTRTSGGLWVAELGGQVPWRWRSIPG